VSRALPAAAVLLLAGCGGGGGGTHLAHTDAVSLIELAHKIPGEQPCAQARDIRALQSKATALVKDHRVPARLQGPLLSGVDALREQAPVCLPPVQASSPPSVPAETTQREGKRHGEHHGHGRGHGKGKH
jgi:hypothetical protein